MKGANNPVAPQSKIATEQQMLSADIVFIYIMLVNKNIWPHTPKRWIVCVVASLMPRQSRRLTGSAVLLLALAAWLRTDQTRLIEKTRGESVYFLPFCGPPIKITAFNILNKWRFVSTVWQLPSVCLLNSSTSTSVIRVVDVTVTHVASWRQRRGANEGLEELFYICGSFFCTWDQVNK